MNFYLNSVILLVGPSNCGKSFFTQNTLVPQLKDFNPNFNIQVLSTDNIRREILGRNLHKYHPLMDSVNNQIFELLYTKLDLVTQFPANADYVIVDSTGLSEDFRQRIKSICQKNHCNLHIVIFDYKNREDYYKLLNQHTPDEYKGKAIAVTTRHIRSLKENNLRQITKKEYSLVDTIKSCDFSSIKIEIRDLDLKQSHIIDNNKQYVIIGDVHENITDLKTLLTKKDFKLEGNKILPCFIKRDNERVQQIPIFIGDLIDKGKNTEETINFVYENLNSALWVIGNHENFVYKYLSGELNKEDESTIDAKRHFTSIELFEAREDLKEKFFTYFNVSKTFFKNDFFIATHAPCEVKYLGKVDSKSLKMMRNIQYPKNKNYQSSEEYIIGLEEFFNQIKTETNRNHPIVIHGHVATEKVLNFNNKYLIDTGSVYGNKLSCVTIYKSNKPQIDFVSSTYEGFKKELPKIYSQKDINLNIDLGSLDSQDFNKIKFAIKDKINFISGTMCPCDKNENILEDYNKGIQYYKSKGVKKLIIQPKWMGSRANVYLFNPLLELENYATTRNGNKISWMDLTSIYDKLYTKFTKEWFIENNLKMIILDAELMPWSALGKGLIDKQFNIVTVGVQSEIDFLKQTGFEEHFNSIANELNHTSFLEEHTKISKKDLEKLYGTTKARLYGNYVKFHKNFTSLDIEQNNIIDYDKQVKIFGKDSELDIKPFSMLKKIYLDDSEEVLLSEEASNIDIYKDVTFDKIWAIANLETNKIDYRIYDKNIHQIELNKGLNDFWLFLTENMSLEGIVMKPEQVYSKGIAPYIKCRNPKYLSIIYGYDYLNPLKISKLIQKKGINSKMNLSIREFEIGKLMLETNYNDIEPKNRDYFKLIANLISDMKYESKIDPRL